MESRFNGQCTTAEGGRQFVEQFLPAVDQPEIRALRLENPLAQIVDRLEYLLEIAGERARATTELSILHQILDSRERGADILRALAEAPNQGINAGDLAKRLKISPSNLSPLLATFHAHGIIDRVRRGRHLFNTLTSQGRALLPHGETAAPQPIEVEFMFTTKPVTLQSVVDHKTAA